MRRNPPAKWVLPIVVNPPRICFQIEVPNDRFHLAAFRGAILNLAAAYKWQDDPDHTAKRVAAVWDDIYTKIRTCETVNCGDQGISLEDVLSQQIRKNPDDPCIQQMWCIDHWEDWYDPRSCIPGTIEQPTNGTPLEAGQCRAWDVSLRGSERWLLPVQVNTGDTITITGASGGWNDGTLLWFCTSGQLYVGSGCLADAAPESGDPLQTANHMRLIMSVDGTFVDAYNQIFAVPVGVSDGQVFFQANDDPLPGNSGTVSFHVEVCKENPPETPITITYGFGSGSSSVLDGGIISVSSGCCGGGGGADTGMKIQFSENVRVEIIGQSGFVLGCPDNCGWMHSSNASDVPIITIYRDDTTNPLDWPTDQVFRNLYVESVTAAATFTLTIRVFRP
jgi:hypothetical protein